MLLILKLKSQISIYRNTENDVLILQFLIMCIGVISYSRFFQILPLFEDFNFPFSSMNDVT